MTANIDELLSELSEKNLCLEELKKILPQIINGDLSEVHPSKIEALADKVGDIGLVDEYEDLLLHENYQENKLILDDINAIKSGKWFPTSDPYTEKEAMEILQIGVERGLYSQEELESTLSEMRNSQIFKNLRRNNEKHYNLDHTPFATGKKGGKKKGLEDYGFHLFIGREFFDNNQECFVTLDVIGSISYTGLNQAFGDLCRAVKKGRKVLLTKNPGGYEHNPNDRLSNASRTYEPLEDEDLKMLRKRFESDPEMKSFENPFTYQPK